MEDEIVMKNVETFVDGILTELRTALDGCTDIPPEVGDKEALNRIHATVTEIGDFIKRMLATQQTRIENELYSMIATSIIPAIALTLRPIALKEYTTNIVIPAMEKMDFGFGRVHVRREIIKPVKTLQ